MSVVKEYNVLSPESAAKLIKNQIELAMRPNSDSSPGMTFDEAWQSIVDSGYLERVPGVNAWNFYAEYIYPSRGSSEYKQGGGDFKQ
jgi:hypothetical protein